MTPDINSPQPSFRPRPLSPRPTEPLPPSTSTPPKAVVGRTRSKKPFFLTLLVLILIAGAGYGGYAFEHHRAVSTENTQQAQITTLQQQVNNLQKQAAKSSSATTSTSPTAASTVFKIPELGIELTVPNSIKDIVYAPPTTYKLSTGQTGSGVSLSTTTLANLDAGCSDTGSAPPLGKLTKTIGQYPASAAATIDNTSGALVKQYPTYYIAFTAPQAACSTNASTGTAASSDLAVFKTSFSTIAPTD